MLYSIAETGPSNSSPPGPAHGGIVPPSAFRLPPSAFRLPRSAFRVPPSDLQGPGTGDPVSRHSGDCEFPVRIVRLRQCPLGPAFSQPGPVMIDWTPLADLIETHDRFLVTTHVGPMGMRWGPKWGWRGSCGKRGRMSGW